MTIIYVPIILWTLIGLIFGLGLYSSDFMPHDDKRKNNLTVLMLGPAWWIVRALVAVYTVLISWLINPEN